MNTVIIPARLKSTRFPNKVIADYHGTPIIQYLHERIKLSNSVDNIYIATSDDKIIDVCKKFTNNIIKTPKNLLSGTDRVGYAVKNNNIKSDIIINIQADQLNLNPEVIDNMISIIKKNIDINIITPVYKFTSQENANNKNTVKVVLDKNHNALYFSRASIPYYRNVNNQKEWYKHIGIYVFRRKFLLQYINWPQSNLEIKEGLEQLRILENGYRIKTYLSKHNWNSIDTPEDLEKEEM